MFVVAGDIGGTTTRLAFAGREDSCIRLRGIRHFDSNRFGGVSPILREFLASERSKPDAICLGVPGPVRDNCAETTNLPWTIDADSLGQELGVDSILLQNDFEAVTWAIDSLSAEDVVTLQSGDPDGRGVVACIGAGTGLGVGYRVSDSNGDLVRPSEGGHASLAPRDAWEWRLRERLASEFGHVSCERVLSGDGLVAIYRFLMEEAGVSESPLTDGNSEEDDPAARVSRAGLEGSDPQAAAALDRFVSLYGSTAGDIALQLLAEGGIYIAGGIAPRILERFQHGPFLDGFLAKGRMRSVLERIPVHVIVHDEPGLLGAASRALRASR